MWRWTLRWRVTPRSDPPPRHHRPFADDDVNTKSTKTKRTTKRGEDGVYSLGSGREGWGAFGIRYFMRGELTVISRGSRRWGRFRRS